MEDFILLVHYKRHAGGHKKSHSIKTRLYHYLFKRKVLRKCYYFILLVWFKVYAQTPLTILSSFYYCLLTHIYGHICCITRTRFFFFLKIRKINDHMYDLWNLRFFQFSLEISNYYDLLLLLSNSINHSVNHFPMTQLFCHNEL